MQWMVKRGLWMVAALALFVLPQRAQAQQTTLNQFSVVNSSTTVPTVLTNRAKFMVTSFTIVGKASAQGSANVGSVYIGTSSTDGVCGYEIATGTTHVFSDPKGRAIDLNTIYVDVVNANDGVTIFWNP